MQQARATAAVIWLVYAAFISLGLPDGILGAAWPQMRVHFDAHLNDNWPMLSLATCGGMLSSFTSGLLLRRIGIKGVLLVTTFLTVTVILGYAASPSLTVLTALSFFLGLSNGAVDAGLNHFAANHLSSRHMNWLHASWGVGVSLGTVVVSGALVAQRTWRSAYVVVAALQLCLGIAFLRRFPTLRESTRERDAPGKATHPPFLSTLALPTSWSSMVTFFVYGGVECGTGLWIASLLHDGRHWSMKAASLMVTVYWGSLTVGRFLIGTVSQRTTPLSLVRSSLRGVVLGTTLIALSSAFAAHPTLAGLLTAGGLLVTGFGLSPIFPMLMHDTPRSVGTPHALNLIGFQAATGALGYTLLPIVMGTVMRLHTTEWLGSMLFGLTLVLVGVVSLRERAISRQAKT
jgi:fucose permease